MGGINGALLGIVSQVSLDSTLGITNPPSCGGGRFAMAGICGPMVGVVTPGDGAWSEVVADRRGSDIAAGLIWLGEGCGPTVVFFLKDICDRSNFGRTGRWARRAFVELPRVSVMFMGNSLTCRLPAGPAILSPEGRFNETFDPLA